MHTTREGILLINKPSGWTSHDVCNFIKKRFKVAKVGHTGTLDPQATGVLVVLVGKYTKLSARFTSFDKEYAGTIELGVTTSTQDGDGEIVKKRDWHRVKPEMIYTIFEQLHGAQKQIPPMVSAIHSHGVRLYTLARKGHEVERKARDIYIHQLVCDKIELPFIHFTVVASKGTYIRTLAHDIGEQLGTGAHLKNLCRTRNGMFCLESCVTVDLLKQLRDRSELQQFLRTDSSAAEIKTP